jgi:hypothetical protein
VSSLEKEPNPKDAIAIKKAPLSCIPMPPLYEEGLVMLSGAGKYGRHNWRVSGVMASVYFDAMMRHMTSWWEGQDDDPESGLSHLAHARACLGIVRDSQLQGNWVDDRPPVSGEHWMDDSNDGAADIMDNCPDPKPAHVASEKIIRMVRMNGQDVPVNPHLK